MNKVKKALRKLGCPPGLVAELIQDDEVVQSILKDLGENDEG